MRPAFRSRRKPGLRSGGRDGRLGRVTEPAHRADEPNLHPGQHDEGGQGGMATREHAAHEQQEQTEEQDRAE